MRHTLKTALAAGTRDDLIGWWQGWPPRQLEFWKTLLFEPGQGWLRWEVTQEIIVHYGGEPDEEVLVPPVRFAIDHLWDWLRVPFALLIGYRHPEHRGRLRLSWEEIRPNRHNYQYLRDPDRRRRLWQI